MGVAERTYGAWEGGIWGILKSRENHGKQPSWLEPWKENKGKVDNHGKQYQASGIGVVEAEMDGNFSGMEGVRAGFWIWSLAQLLEEMARSCLSGKFLLLDVLQDESTISLKGAFVG